jgi:hypothetical protein
MKGVMVTANQVKKIHTLKSLLNVREETYRRMLGNYNVATSKALSFHQANEFIQLLEHFARKKGLWENYAEKHEKLSCRTGMATPAQLRMIEGIWAELYPETERKRATALRTYLFRFFKVSDLRFLDAEKVNKVLHALKQMKARKERTAKKASESFFDPEGHSVRGKAT